MNTLLCFAVVLGSQLAESPWQDVSNLHEQQSTGNIATAKPAQGGRVFQAAVRKLSTFTDLVPKLNNVSPAATAQVTPIQDNAVTSTHPALWLRISRQRLADYVERSVNRTKPVRDIIVGTPINGESHTTGNVRLILYSNKSNALGEIVFEGKVDAFTIGHKGPAVMEYDSRSTVRGHKQIIVNETGLVAMPAVVEAPTKLRPTSIRTNLPGLRGRIAQRIARQRVSASIGQATAEVANHTARDICHDLDAKVDDSIASIQSVLKTQLASMKNNDGAGPFVVCSRSTQNFVELAVCEKKDATQPMPTFDVAGDSDIAVRIHRSLLAKIATTPELLTRLSPLLGTAVAGELAGSPSADNKQQHSASSAKWTLNGDWIAADFTPNAVLTRVALQNDGEELTIK